jgi:hypothetical protein
MTRNYKDILLKELSARMPYGLKVQCDDYLFTFDENHMGVGAVYTDYYGKPLESPNIILSGCYYGDDIKPYLYPLSSMTEEQYEEFIRISGWDVDIDDVRRGKFSCIGYVGLDYIYDTIDWFNKNHFDYRELIQMGLAIDATGLDIYDR